MMKKVDNFFADLLRPLFYIIFISGVILFSRELIYRGGRGDFWHNYHFMDTAEVVVQVIAVILLYRTLYHSQTTFVDSLRETRYDAIDKLYFDLLNIRRDNIDFGTPDKITDPNRYEPYSVYAYMVWNLIESILDKCTRDPDLMETWDVVIEQEARRHGSWFANPVNQPNFKYKFRKEIEDRKYIPGFVAIPPKRRT
jgi:hypothetical protein